MVLLSCNATEKKNIDYVGSSVHVAFFLSLFLFHFRHFQHFHQSTRQNVWECVFRARSLLRYQYYLDAFVLFSAMASASASPSHNRITYHMFNLQKNLCFCVCEYCRYFRSFWSSSSIYLHTDAECWSEKERKKKKGRADIKQRIDWKWMFCEMCTVFI